MKKGQCSHSKSKSSLQKNKPFCDCKDCQSKNCPHVLKNLGITVSSSGVHFNTKLDKAPTNVDTSQNDDFAKSLLSKLKSDRHCNCAVMARALHSNIHINIGMSDRRTDAKRKSTSEQGNPEEK